MRPEILDRFVCAKYLFLSAIESLDRGGPYAAGLAVLSFQDAAELLLRTIAEHLHAPVKENAAFHQVLDDVEKVCNQPLTHRTALIQLNHSRVKFKHHGLLPRDEDARKFRNDLEGFFPSVLKNTLNLRFDELSLASLVRHTRTRNWLLKAEQFLLIDNFADSIEASAVAFAVFQHAQRPRYEGQSLESVLRASESRRRSDHQIHPGVYRLAEEMEKKIAKLREQSDLVSRGVDYDQFRRFTDLTPDVSLSTAGVLWFSDRRPRDANTYDNALFCSSFATQLILRLQDGYREREYFRRPETSRFRVVRKGPIIVWPGDKNGDETIREVELGAELVGYDEKLNQPDYVAIVQDDECAFISSQCVERIGSMPIEASS